MERLVGMLSNLDVEFLEPVMTKGLAQGENFRALDRLAEIIAARHREIGC